MILPRGYQVGKRYPVVVNVYPGVGAHCDEPTHLQFNRLGSSSTFDLHILAARGYIVLEPNTSHFLTNKPPNPIGGMPAAVDASLDALIAQGFADPDRIGLMGVSQGGYASLWLATQMRRFKAIVSINGWRIAQYDVARSCTDFDAVGNFTPERLERHPLPDDQQATAGAGRIAVARPIPRLGRIQPLASLCSRKGSIACQINEISRGAEPHDLVGRSPIEILDAGL